MIMMNFTSYTRPVEVHVINAPQPRLKEEVE
jgi:hypothetical protein